jgi:outer membrane protein insertion porin family
LNASHPVKKRAHTALFRLLISFCAIGTAVSCATTFAQQAGEVVTSVEFVGLQRTAPAMAHDVVNIRPGSPISRAALDEAVARLLRTGRFTSVQYDIRDGGRIVFEVVERSSITSMRFEGATIFRENTLKAEVPQKIGEPLDVSAVREGRDAILRKYREAGHTDATVEVDEAAASQTGEIVFVIHEGPKVKVRNIEFEGNTAFTGDELAKQIETKTAFWFFRSGAFDHEKAEGDAARLQNFYRDEGFLDATASFTTRLDRNDMTVVFSISEGTRYSFEDIQVKGNTVFGSDEILAQMKSCVGEIVRRPQVDADVTAIRDRYGELGYIYVRVRAVRVFSDSPGLVRLTIEIEEDEQFRVGRVVVRGNARTKDKVARRALNLYPPDDLFNLSEARKAEKDLVETRVFSSARVIPSGDEPGVRDAVIDVVESEKAGDFLFGVGVTSNSGVVGSVVLDFQNFDLFDTPESWNEFVKLRSFYGGGQRLRLELQPGTEVSRFRVDFTEPYLFDKPLRFDSSFFLFERERDGYTENRIGSSYSLGKRFERGRLQGWSGELALRNEMVDVEDLDLFTSSEIRDDEGSNLITGLKGTLVRDRTDSRFVPTTGDRLRLSYEQVVGDHFFGRAGVGYNWYTTLATDRLERKSVLALRGEGGYIIGDAPVFERFYAGGIGSIRGFQYRGVGERDGLDDNNIGGDYLILVGAEYSYPLYGENLRGHVFLDTGTAGSGGFRAGVGTGVRFTLNIFGPIPIELNVAMPVSADSEDEEQIFSFVVGSIF